MRGPSRGAGVSVRLAFTLVKRADEHTESDLDALVGAFREDNPAEFYELLVNSSVLYAVTQVESLWQRVGDEDELKSHVYFHFLQSWERIRAGALPRGDAIGGYLVETIRNSVRDALRKKERRKRRERELVRGGFGNDPDERGSDAEAVAAKTGSVLDELIAEEHRESMLTVVSDPELAKFGAVFKLKMLMRCNLDDAPRFAMSAEEAAWTPGDESYPHPRAAGRVAAWVVRLRRWDPAGRRFKPTSRKLVCMLGMADSGTPEEVEKEKANTFDQWFRRAKVKFRGAEADRARPGRGRG